MLAGDNLYVIPSYQEPIVSEEAVDVREVPVPSDYQEELTAVVTAYSSSPDETWGDPFIAANGERVFDGLVACPRRYPFDTLVLINGRVYVCGDRLHPKYDSRFDIWMDSKQKALNFGKKEIEVKVSYP